MGLDKKKKDVDETLTAKTGDVSHDNEVKKKIGQVKDPKAKAELTQFFNSGKTIDV